MNNINNLIGKHIRYYDEMDSELFGNIVAIEIQPRENDDDIYWIYIMDEDSANREKHNDEVNGVLVTYTDLRPSIEIELDE